MYYNTKVINYPNGSTQIRLYVDLIQADYEKKKTKFDYDGWEKITEESILDCPFDTEIIEWSEEDKKIIKKYRERKSSVEERKRVSFNRSKQMVFAYSRSCSWNYFCTFTFNDSKIDRYNYDDVSKAFRKWLNNIKKKYAPNLKYLFIPEQHQDGAWHMHGLIAGIGDIELIDSGHKYNNEVVYHCKHYKLGFNNITKVTDIKRVSSYVCKYITKDMCNLIKGKQRYFVSQNLPKAEVIEQLYEPSKIERKDFIIELADSIGKDICHIQVKENAFHKIYYIELE